MAKFNDIIVNTARTFGSAVGAFTKAKDQMLRKPEFISGLAQSSAWAGGSFTNVDAAQMRAARNSWFYAGINKKALDLSGSKGNVFYNPSGLEDEGEPAEAHPFLKVLRRPNPYMGKSLLMQYTAWWMDLQGEAYWFVEPDGANGIKGIYPIPANKMDIEFTDDFKNIKRYVLKLSQWYYIDPKYVIQFKYPNPWDFFRGLPPLIAYILTIDADLAMKMWNGSFFGKDNVMPSAVISLGTGDANNLFEDSDLDNVRNELKNEYSAIKRKTVITNANTMSVAMLGYNAKDMDFLAGMQWNKEEILLALGIPPGMLDKNATEANAKVGSKTFKDHMWGIKCLLADEITAQCLQVFYNVELEYRFDDDRVYDRDMELKEAVIAKDAMPREMWAEKYFDVTLKPGDVTMSEAKAQQQIEATNARLNAGLEKEKLRGDKYPGNKFKQNSATSNTTPSKEDVTKKAVNQYRPWMELDVSEEEYFNNVKHDELERFKTKALNKFRHKGNADIEFSSVHLQESTVKAILSDLEGAESKEDIGFIFDHWEGALFSEEGNIKANTVKALSWRPWSIFESLFTSIIQDALKSMLDILVLRAWENLDKDVSVWDEISADYKKKIEPIVRKVASKAIEDIKAMGATEVGVSYNLTNDKAQEVALQYAAEQITKVNDTTKKAVRNAIGEWISEGRANGIQGLRERLMNLKDENGVELFGEARAKRIAQSELTSIYAAATESGLVANGYIKTVYKPRAHVNCRCYIQPGRLPDGTKVIIWYTARDEIVCTKELDTPFGLIKGCRELHRTVVSEGHAGVKLESNQWNPKDRS